MDPLTPGDRGPSHPGLQSTSLLISLACRGGKHEIERGGFWSQAEECPICFLFYPALNRSACCNKGICTECYLQVRGAVGPELSHDRAGTMSRRFVLVHAKVSFAKGAAVGGCIAGLCNVQSRTIGVCALTARTREAASRTARRLFEMMQM